MTQALLIRHAAPAACGAPASSMAPISKVGLLDRLSNARHLIGCWRARCAYRRDLARLQAAGPHLVRDLGLDEADAREEIRKPFWQA